MSRIVETREYMDGDRRIAADIRDDMTVTFRVWLNGEDQGANARVVTVSVATLCQLMHSAVCYAKSLPSPSGK